METEYRILIERVWRAAAMFPEMPVPRTIPRKLPLLDSFRQLPEWRPQPHDGPVLFIQHQLAHLATRIEAALQDGLDRRRSWFLDIPYSTHPDVYQWIVAKFGANHLPEQHTDALAPYSETQAFRLKTMLNRIAEAEVRGPLLVVDDGGYFVKYVAELHHTNPKEAEAYRGSLIVEQTTRGHWALESSEKAGILAALGIRAVSVAQSLTKRIFEGPFIGASIASRMTQVLVDRHRTPGRALIIGFGTVGSACARVLGSGNGSTAMIDVLETDGSKAASVRAAGFRLLDRMPGPGAPRYDIVLGCTGRTSFKPVDRHLLEHHAILASGSSGSVEFDRKNWVDEADSDPHDAFELQGNRQEMHEKIHSDMTFVFEGGRELTILNAGFPINFDGRLTDQPTVCIQPTHCLLHAAVAEVLEKKEPKLYSLSNEADYWLLKKAVELLPGSQV